MPPVVSPVLIGRSEHIERLEKHLEDALAGSGIVVFVSGEAGVGKSRLVRCFADYARERSTRVLFGRAAQLAETVPFKPLVHALQASVRDEELNDPSLERYRASLARLLGIESGPSNHTGTPTLLEGLSRQLRVMAQADGLLLVLEDLHWADPDTLAAIDYFSDTLTDAKVLLLITERSDPSSASGLLVDELVARRAAHRIHLPALLSEQVQELAERALNVESVPQGLLDALGARAGGLPFLIEELLGAYVEAGGPSERQPEWWVSRRIADAIPHSLREMVATRLELLDQPTFEVVTAAAVLGRAFDRQLLAPITGLQDREIVRGLRNAVRANLLVSGGEHFPSYEFRHALVREAVLAEMPPESRAEFARRAARAIEDMHPGVPGEWCERAAQLYEEGGEALSAIRLLQESALRALGRSALNSAEATLVRARELAGNDYMVWLRVDELLLDVYYLSGKTEGLVQLGQSLIGFLLERYQSVFAASRLAGLHLKVARGALSAGDRELARHHLDAAHELAEEDGDEVVLARVGALRAHAALIESDFEAARAFAAKAVDDARRISLLETQCDALDALGAALYRLVRGDEALAVFEDMERLSNDPRMLSWKIRALVGVGSIDAMTRSDVDRLMTARRLALNAGAVASLASIDLHIGKSHLERAAFDSAQAFLEKSLEASRLHGLPTHLDALVSMSMLHALRDDADAVEEIQGEPLTAGPVGIATRFMTNGPVVLALARGDDEGALARLDEAARAESEEEVRWWRGLHALLALAQRGDDSVLTELKSQANLWRPVIRGYLAYAQALACARVGDEKGTTEHVAEGGYAMAPGWRRHHARRVLADAALESGWGDPVAWTNEALDFFDAAGLPGFVAACRSTLRRAGAPIRRRGRGESVVPRELHRLGVTSREMDVLALVAERLSNREIAERLFLSPRTVESHVASLMRKTEMEARADLVALGQRYAHDSIQGRPLS